DEENEIIVRGNSPRMLLWRVEGIEVPSPNHFSEEGASSGAVSILSTNMLANSDFSTGAFPSEYGNALSGVFDIRLRNGNNEQREYALSAGVLGLDFSAEAPFQKGKQASYLINYRYSSLALLQKAGLNIVGDAVPVFQDLSFKINLPTQEFGTFSVFGLGGLSHIEENETGLLPDSTEGVLWEDRSSSDMGVVGLNHKLVLGDKTLLSSAISTSASRIQYQWRPRNEKGEFPVDETEDFLNLSTRVQSTLTHKFNARHLLKVGAIYSLLSYDMLMEYFADEPGEWITTLDDQGSAHVWQGFASWRFRISQGLTFNAGLHSMYFGLNKKYTLEPRASLKWQLNDQQYLSAGFGIHSRRDGLSLYLARKEESDGSFIQPNRNLDFTKAMHFVLGYDVMFNKDLHLRLETYYQNLYDVPVFDDSSSVVSILNSVSPFTTQKLVNEGIGRNYGVEVTLEKFFSNNYYFLITSSLYQSKYTALDGIERNTRFNGNYVNNFLAGKDFPIGRNKNNLITTSARLIWAGGKRYTPV
ncbi:MAG: TonB-dependent receptor, partial [Bacteroidetes bacterium]|nr:TonB-dependent receptor [Bacteroidota bacterium]